MYTQVSICPKCGAPIYVKTMWGGTTPPPAIYSCNCLGHSANTSCYSTYIKMTGKLNNDKS